MKLDTVKFIVANHTVEYFFSLQSLINFPWITISCAQAKAHKQLTYLDVSTIDIN